MEFTLKVKLQSILRYKVKTALASILRHVCSSKNRQAVESVSS